MSSQSVLVPSKDGKQAIVKFPPEAIHLLRNLGLQLRQLLTGDDDTNQTSPLFPPAYGDDFMRQVEYDRVSRERLADSHVHAVDQMLHMLDCERADIEQIENFMKAVNQIRLVIGRKLGIAEQTWDEEFNSPQLEEDRFPPGHPEHQTYVAYQYLAAVQHDAIDVLIAIEPFDYMEEGEDEGRDENGNLL